MGHATVSIIKKGLLSRKEIESLIKERKDQDRLEYGNGENLDSFVHASSPSFKYTDKIYKELSAEKIIDNIGSYDSFVIYLIKNDDWDKFFVDNKVIRKKDKIKESIRKKNEELKLLASEYWKKSNIDEVSIPIFLNLECCKSKINLKGLIKRQGSFPSTCPVCGRHDNNLGDKARIKAYGKSYLLKKQRLENKINSLNKEYNEINEKTISEVYLNSLSVKDFNKLKSMAITVICADVHQ